jgi:hypothetical protein
LNSKRLAEEEAKVVNRMKKKALQAEFQRKEVERVRHEQMMKEEALGKNPTSLHGRVAFLADRDVEIGAPLR